MVKVERVLTGIPGLDQLIDGGFPEGRVILIVGGPGAGKTIMCAQFLANGVREYEENGVFVSLDETKHHFYRETDVFRFNLKELEEQKKFVFLNAAPTRHIPEDVSVAGVRVGRKDFSMASLIEGIKTAIELVDAKRVAVDTVTSLIFQYPDIFERRTAILDLIDSCVNTGTTCIITSELKEASLEREFQLEEYLAHGVISLQIVSKHEMSDRKLQVLKMRETKIDPTPRPYEISKEGIKVFPESKVFG